MTILCNAVLAATHVKRSTKYKSYPFLNWNNEKDNSGL